VLDHPGSHINSDLIARAAEPARDAAQAAFLLRVRLLLGSGAERLGYLGGEAFGVRPLTHRLAGSSSDTAYVPSC
jgi:hypothetical protein